MTFPNRQAYDRVVTHLDKFNRSGLLEGGRPRIIDGKLVAYSGGVARVYPIELEDRTIALRCWISQVDDKRARFGRLQEYLLQNPTPYFVNFDYIEKGIVCNGSVWPVLVMDWVPGLRLNEFLDKHIDDSELIRSLAENFAGMVRVLHDHSMSHGDLQDGNIWICNERSRPKIMLIDYDSVYAPPLDGLSPNLKGVSGYQHPQRASQSGKIDLEKIDYFSELVIYLSLRAYAENPDLWVKDNELRLLFTVSDFEKPESSESFLQLRSLSRETQYLALQLREFCNQKDLNRLLPLEEVLNNGRGKPVAVHEVDVYEYFSLSKQQTQEAEIVLPVDLAPSDKHSDARAEQSKPSKQAVTTKPAPAKKTTQPKKSPTPKPSAKQKESSGCGCVFATIVGILVLIGGFLYYLGFIPPVWQTAPISFEIAATSVSEISQPIAASPTAEIPERPVPTSSPDGSGETQGAGAPEATDESSEPQLSQPSSEPTPTLNFNLYVVEESINIREGPSLRSEIVGYAFKGEVLESLGINHNSTWYQVIFFDDQVGWVAASVVDPISMAEASAIATEEYNESSVDESSEPLLQISVNAANLRNGPGSEYDVVATLPNGTPLTVVGRTNDGFWFRVQVPGGGKAWIGSSVSEPMGSWNLTDVSVVE